MNRVLDELDLATNGWGKLEKHYKEKLHTLRASNDWPQSEENTALIRGEIKMVKNFLALATPDQQESDGS